MSRMACVVVAVLLAGTACSLLQPSSTASVARTSPVQSRLAQANGALEAEVAMPAGFPADFPIYPRARLTAASSFASIGQVAWGMEWETTDAELNVQTYYMKQLNVGDWMFTLKAGRNNAIDGTFARRSDKNVQGTVEVNRDAVVVTKILVSLAAPA